MPKVKRNLDNGGAFPATAKGQKALRKTVRAARHPKPKPQPKPKPKPSTAVTKAPKPTPPAKPMTVKAFSKQYNDQAKEINVRFEQATKADGKASDHRLAAAIMLGEMKGTCKEKQVSFAEWVEKNITQAYKDVCKLVRISQAKDPALAIADMRFRNAASNQKLRDKAKKAKPRAPAPAPTPETAAVDAIARLDDASRIGLIKASAASDGMAIVAKNYLKGVEASAKLGKSRAEKLTGIDNLIMAFNALDPAEQMVLARHAAEAVGLPLAEAPPEPDVSPKEAGPKFIRRVKRQQAERAMARGLK